MKYLKRYKNNNPKTYEQMKYVIENCQVTDEYITSLDLLAMNYDILYNCIEDMEKNGLEKKDQNNRSIKNHAVSLFQYAQNTILKILASFPSNPMTKAKIKQIEKADESNVEDIIADLMN